MSDSEDKPPTLASLRARRGKNRLGKKIVPLAPAGDSPHQAGLFSAPIETPSVSTERRIWSVRALVSNIRQHVETAYTDIWIEGEISNCRPAPSGHIYFTLKDGEAQLPVVLFRRQASLLRFRPVDGLAVMVRGQVSVYESRGQLQFIAESMEPRGVGSLQLAFEQLKTRLLAEGLFDAARKRPLPAFPKCIGIVTSLGGAVVRDIVTIVRRRHVRLNLIVYPATMQGMSSPGSVAAGIRWFNANSSLVDVIVLARGGGSPEDLAGFNDEELARVIAASELPIVSAIGHETDFTIADFVADLRAPTPSAAAELITAAQHLIEERIVSLADRVQRAGRFHLMEGRQKYIRLSAESVLIRVRDAVNRRGQHLDDLRFQLEDALQRRIRISRQRLLPLVDRIRRQNIAIQIASARRRLQDATLRLHRTTIHLINRRRTSVSNASVRIEVLSPLAVLSRGYALVYADDGRLLSSVTDTAPGRTIRARLAHGVLESQVTRTTIDTVDLMETDNS
jgi:exodeoxyribonuclease VII large subunit